MPRSEFKKLVADYGEVKANKAAKWFGENFSPEFRASVYQAEFCITNEFLWNC